MAMLVITKWYIPLNPIKPPFSYGFPMVFQMVFHREISGFGHSLGQKSWTSPRDPPGIQPRQQCGHQGHATLEVLSVFDARRCEGYLMMSSELQKTLYLSLPNIFISCEL